MGPDGEMPHFSDDPANITPTATTVKIAADGLYGLFSEVRHVVIRGDEIVQGLLRPGLHPDGPELRAILTSWGGTHFLHQSAPESVRSGAASAFSSLGGRGLRAAWTPGSSAIVQARRHQPRARTRRARRWPLGTLCP